MMLSISFTHNWQVGEFYFIRYFLAFICATCQTQLFRVINGIFNPRVALFFMMATIFSPGVFHASVAFLPSSFSMYTTMLSMAAFMDWRGSLKTVRGIFWFAVGGILGWPFAAALSIPFILEELYFALIGSKLTIKEAAVRFLRGSGAALMVLVSFHAII